MDKERRDLGVYIPFHTPVGKGYMDNPGQSRVPLSQLRISLLLEGWKRRARSCSSRIMPIKGSHPCSSPFPVSQAQVLPVSMLLPASGFPGIRQGAEGMLSSLSHKGEYSLSHLIALIPIHGFGFTSFLKSPPKSHFPVYFASISS